jgi:hypothetical protein
MFKPVTKTPQNKHLLENDEDGLQFISKMNSTSNKNLYANIKNLCFARNAEAHHAIVSPIEHNVDLGIVLV